MERLSVPQTAADQPRVPQANEEAPAETAGSFLHTVNSNLKITPSDEETGVTYPIVTTRRLPPINKSSNSDGVIVADWNHAYHPRERLIRGTALENALRNARIEWVHRDDHNSYHKEFFGPAIGDEQQMIRQVIFAAAGFVPSKGLHYDGRKEAEVVNLNRRQRLSLWNSNRIRIVNEVSLREGLMEVALRNDFSGINESTIDEFLHTTDPQRRFTLGSNLLSMALIDLTTPLKPLYKEMHEKQQLRPDAPKRIGKFALKLVSQSKRKRALGILEGRLRAV